MRFPSPRSPAPSHQSCDHSIARSLASTWLFVSELDTRLSVVRGSGNECEAEYDGQFLRQIGTKHSYITLRLDGLQVSIGISLQLEQYEKFITRHIHTSVLSNPRSQGACHM